MLINVGIKNQNHEVLSYTLPVAAAAVSVMISPADLTLTALLKTDAR